MGYFLNGSSFYREISGSARRSVPDQDSRFSKICTQNHGQPSRGPNNYMFWAMIEAAGEVGIP